MISPRSYAYKFFFSAQRLALVVVGRDWIRLENSKNPKPEKRL